MMKLLFSLLFCSLFVGSSVALVTCSDNACCQTAFGPGNFKTGHGFHQFNEVCLNDTVSITHCVEASGCQICRADWSNPDPGNRPFCGFNIPIPTTYCGDVYKPSPVPCSVSVVNPPLTTDDYIGIRFRSFANTGGSEVYIGVTSLLGQGNGRVERDYTWPVATPSVSLRNIPFKITYVDDSVRVEMQDFSLLWTGVAAKLASAGKTNLAALNVMTLTVTDNNDMAAATSVTVSNLIFNDQTFPGTFQAKAGGPNVKAVHFTGVSFAVDFVLTGTLSLVGTFPRAGGQERSKVEINFGIYQDGAACVPGSPPNGPDFCCGTLQFANTDTGQGFLEFDAACKFGGLNCFEETGCSLCQTPDATENLRPICRRFASNVVPLPQKTVTHLETTSYSSVNVGSLKYVFQSGASIDQVLVQAKKTNGEWTIGRVESTDGCLELNQVVIDFQEKPAVGTIFQAVASAPCLTTPGTLQAVFNETCLQVTTDPDQSNSSLSLVVTASSDKDCNDGSGMVPLLALVLMSLLAAFF